jgi:hypothetical protein
MFLNDKYRLKYNKLKNWPLKDWCSYITLNDLFNSQILILNFQAYPNNELIHFFYCLNFFLLAYYYTQILLLY